MKEASLLYMIISVYIRCCLGYIHNINVDILCIIFIIKCRYNSEVIKKKKEFPSKIKEKRLLIL